VQQQLRHPAEGGRTLFALVQLARLAVGHEGRVDLAVDLDLGAIL
jgi:hypothetical protein